MPQTYDNYGRLKVVRGLPGAIETFPGDGPALSAFGQQRIVTPETLADGDFYYNALPLIFQTTTASGATATHNATRKVLTLAATSTAGSKVVFQQRQYNLYQRGKSQRIKQTFVLGAAVAGFRKRLGYFDEANGLYFEQAADGTLKFVVRSSGSGSVVNTEYAQAAWSVDTFGGGGVSGVTLNPAYQQILDYDFQWLGAGRVRWSFNIDGLPWYATYSDHANLSGDAPYMQTGSLPLRYEVENVSAGASSASMDLICFEVESEGGTQNESAYHFTGGNRVTTRTASGDRYPLMAIRPAATFNSIVNRIKFILEGIAVYAASTVLWEILYNAAPTGGAWAAVNTNSAVEVNTTLTGITGGIATESGYASGEKVSISIDTSVRYPFCLDIAGANPIGYVVAITPLTGTVATAAQLGWREVR